MSDVVEIARTIRRKLNAEFTRYEEFLRVAEGLCALYAAEQPRERAAGAAQSPTPHPHPNGNALGVTPGFSPGSVKGG